MDMCSVRGMGVAERGQYIDAALELLERLLVLDAEALLLVHDGRPRSQSVHPAQQPVRADQDVDLALLELLQNVLLLLRGAEAESISMRTGKCANLFFDGLIMLLRQNRRRHEGKRPACCPSRP